MCGKNILCRWPIADIAIIFNLNVVIWYIRNSKNLGLQLDLPQLPVFNYDDNTEFTDDDDDFEGDGDDEI